MADNVTVTQGSGKTVATDDEGGSQFQRIKLVDGSDASSARIAGCATYGLDVDVTRIAAGDNNIGNVDIVTAPVRDRTTDNVGVAQSTDAIMNDTSVLTPKFAKIDAASSGDNTIVAAVTGKHIRVVSLMLMSAGTVTARFESGASGTALSGQMNLVANTGFCLPYNPIGWFQTASAELLNIELSAAISVDGILTYIEVPA